MGNRASSLVENTVNEVNQIALNVFMKNHTRTDSVISGSQTNRLVLGGNCKITNSRFSNLSKIRIVADTNIDDEFTMDFQENLSSTLANGLKETKDPALQALSTVMNPGGKSTSRSKNITNITNTFSSAYNKETLTELSRKINSTQLNELKCKKNAMGDALTLENQFDAEIFEKVFKKSKSIVKLQRDILTRVEQKADSEQRSKLLEAIHPISALARVMGGGMDNVPGSGDALVLSGLDPENVKSNNEVAMAQISAAQTKSMQMMVSSISSCSSLILIAAVAGYIYIQKKSGGRALNF